MARWDHMEESDRICHCGQIPGPHPAHFMCGCGMGDQCPYEAKVGAPLLHEGQRGYERAVAKIQGTGKRAGKAARREVHGSSPLKALWNMFVGMGMYSQDPQISHPAMLIRGQQLLRGHAEVTAQAQADADIMAEDRMQRQARLTAIAIADEMERRQRSAAS